MLEGSETAFIIQVPNKLRTFFYIRGLLTKIVKII
jgi:hypothetical protein